MYHKNDITTYHVNTHNFILQLILILIIRIMDYCESTIVFSTKEAETIYMLLLHIIVIHSGLY